jgi:hypothetical protein
MGNVLRRTETPQRHTALDQVAEGGIGPEVVLGVCGIDRAGRNGIDQDIEFRPLQRQGLGQGFDTGLSSRWGDETGRPFVVQGRRDVDHFAPTACDHM